MGRTKKILLMMVAIVLIAGGVFYYLNSKDNYDPSKYSATITKAPLASDASDAPGEPENSPPKGSDEASEAPTGLSKGTRVELTLPDQFDKAHTIPADTTTLILAFSKGAGGKVRAYLDKQEAGFLGAHKAIFAANISPIPVVIRNSLALPALRKSSYSVLLIYEEEIADALMNKEQSDKIHIVTLLDNVVQDIQYVASEAELAAALP